MKRMLIFVVAVLAGQCCHGEVVQHRGIWLHPEQFRTPELAEEWIAKVAAARLNVIYPLVWYHGGTAWYRSDLCPMAKDVPAGSDPLGHLVNAAHERHIDVHAWFVNGSCGNASQGPILARHPEWELQARKTGGDGARWYDFGKPEVRDFQRDVMLECLKRYDLEGIHFDYIRYSDQAVCRCAHCEAEFLRKYGYSPQRGFPLALSVASNPLGKPTTAQVLATFDSGVPAITLNELGKGEVLLINWIATSSACPAVEEFVRRMLGRFGARAEGMHQLQTTQTAAKYREEVQKAAQDWFKGLGFATKKIDETRLSSIPKDGVLLLASQYVIDEPTARWIEGFVADGGRCIFIDGPVFGIKHEALRRAIGMGGQAGYFRGATVIRPAAGQDIIAMGPAVDVEKEKQRIAKWAEYRTWTVSELVRSVYRGAKEIKPGAYVSAAVFYKKASADAVCQDWYGWLKEGCIDYVLPMAYTENQEELAKAFAEWRAADPGMGRIVPGLSIYSKTDHGPTTRDLGLVNSQLAMCSSNQTRGNLFFCLKYLNDDLVAALSGGVFSQPAKAYYPPKGLP